MGEGATKTRDLMGPIGTRSRLLAFGNTMYWIPGPELSEIRLHGSEHGLLL